MELALVLGLNCQALITVAYSILITLDLQLVLRAGLVFQGSGRMLHLEWQHSIPVNGLLLAVYQRLQCIAIGLIMLLRILLFSYSGYLQVVLIILIVRIITRLR